LAATRCRIPAPSCRKNALNAAPWGVHSWRMADSDWSTDLAKFGYAAQQKFDFYTVALAFTVLGLAIQTAHFGARPLADLAELIGWCSLLVSGIAGLKRLEVVAHVFQFMGLSAGQQDRLTGLRKAREQGTSTIRTLDKGKDLDISELIAREEGDLGKIEEKIAEISGTSQLAYRIRSVALWVGLAALMVARGLGPLLGLLRATTP